MSNAEATKHKFYYGEETYTICVTKDDWWIEEVGDMSERMMRAGEEFALRTECSHQKVYALSVTRENMLM
jgi:hypothetical protein